VGSDGDAHEQLQQLLSVFHHEAGTPVALIGSVLRHLQRGGSLGSEDEEMVAAACRQLDVLERLLDQVRVANEGELQLAVEPVELGEVVEELVADLGSTVLEHHPTQVHAPHGPVWVEADPARIRQLLSNLLDNAAQYSDAGTVVEVEVRRDGSRAVLWVTDQGTGIAPPDLERIFGRYERANEGTEGLGLGLYVVWRIVGAHGGSVEALPAPTGRGTRFVVALPALEP
jgi:signal transduction histidine kinase